MPSASGRKRNWKTGSGPHGIGTGTIWSRPHEYDVRTEPDLCRLSAQIRVFPAATDPCRKQRGHDNGRTLDRPASDLRTQGKRDPYRIQFRYRTQGPYKFLNQTGNDDGFYKDQLSTFLSTLYDRALEGSGKNGFWINLPGITLSSKSWPSCFQRPVSSFCSVTQGQYSTL
jgi:hypothetical protein